MNAVRKLHTFTDALFDDVLHGAPIEGMRLDADEALAFLDEMSEENTAHAMQEAIGELWAKGREKELHRYNALVRMLMSGKMTADELLEWRDIQRAALIDYASDWARKEMEKRDRRTLTA